MAINRKEYEMLFQLNAQMGGSYNSTFIKAQSQVAAMQKEIAALSSTQSDISAYQKQQSALEATRQKLLTLQQQYDNIQKEIGETEGYSSSLENQLLSKQQQIEKTTAAIERQSEKLDQMGQALNAAGVDTNDLQGESARLGKEIDDIRDKQNEAAESASAFGTEAAAAFGAIQTAIASAGIAEALQEIVEAYMECVTVSGDFEAGMSNVEALSGATKEELAVLTATAKELGATTVFTAQQSADAMGYMAMAGWDAADMVSGIDGVLQLAAAAGEDLALVSDIVTDNLTAFGLTAADTARFADVLAAAATNSNTSVSVMGETFKMSASIAGALGYSVEDVAVAVGLMANSGIKGSIAGTALKNTFNGLLEGVTITGAAFGEYECSAIQADGAMKDFSGTIDELRYYFDQMTEAERVNNAMTIAGARGYNGLLAILNATDADYASLTDSINSCSGAASKMAAIKQDNLNGDLAIMNSAWEGLQITLGDLYNTEMRSLYTLGGELFALLDQFIQQNPGLAKGIMAFVGVLATATAGLTAYAAITKVVIPLMKLFTASIPGVGPFLALTGVVASFTGILAASSAATETEAEAVRSLTNASREEYYQLQELKSEYDSACEVYGETSEEARELAGQVDYLSARFEVNKQSISEYTAEVEEAAESARSLLDSNKEAYEEISNDEYRTLALVTRLQELASQTDRTVETQEEMKAIVAELNGIVPELAISYDDVISGVTDYATAIEAAVRAQAAQKKYEAASGYMLAAYNKKVDATVALEKATNDQAAALERYNEAEAARIAYLEKGDYDPTYLALEQEYIDLMNEVGAAITEYDSCTAAIATHNETIKQATEDHEYYRNELVGYIEATNEATSTSAALTNRINETVTEMEALAEAYTLAYEAAYSSVSGQYALWDEAADVVATSAGTINTALDSQITYWQDYNSNLQSLTDRSKDIEGLSDMIASFADGSADSVNAVAGMANATDEELAAMVEDWQNLQAEQKKVADSIAELTKNLDEEMAALQRSLESDIEAMNLSEEAAASGKYTIEGFIDGAEDMLPQVQAAYRRLANAAIEALGFDPSGNGSTDTGINLPGYAGGTHNAERGFAVVGENGPELVYFNGGEQVMTAAETAAAMAAATSLQTRAAEVYAMTDPSRHADALVSNGGGGSTNIPPIQVNVTVQGNASSETIEDIRSVTEEMIGEILDAIDERKADRSRRSYQ